MGSDHCLTFSVLMLNVTIGVLLNFKVIFITNLLIYFNFQLTITHSLAAPWNNSILPSSMDEV